MKRALMPIVGLVLIVAACSGDDAGGSSTSLSPDTTAAASTTAAPATTTSVLPATTVVVTTSLTATTSAPTASAASVLLSAEAMWEGEMQTIVLYDDGLLVAGSSQGQAELTGANEYWMGEQARISVVDLGSADHAQAILVELPTADDEDPPNVNQIFVAEGKALRPVLNQAYGVYNVTQLTFVGDGTIEYQEDGWTACLRAEMPDEVNRQVVTLGFVGDVIEEISRRDSAETQQCDRLAG